MKATSIFCSIVLVQRKPTRKTGRDVNIRHRCLPQVGAVGDNNISLFPPIRRVHIQKNIYTMQIQLNIIDDVYAADTNVVIKKGERL